MYINELEFSPLSQKGKKAIAMVIEQVKNLSIHCLTEQQVRDINERLLDEFNFLSRFYVKPFTRFCLKEEVEDDEKIDYTSIHNLLLVEETGFLSHLKSDSLKIFWIYGNAGCGKTTYLHKLKIDLKNTDMFISDFEDLILRIELDSTDGTKIKIGNAKKWKVSHCFKFCITLINIIINRLNVKEFLKSKDSTYLKSVINIYNELIAKIQVPDIVDKFFVVLKEFMINFSDDSLMNFADFFNIIVNEIVDDNNNGDSISSLMEILAYILLVDGKIKGRRQFIAFDNIEYFIKVQYDRETKYVIPDKTVETILQNITDPLEDIADIWIRNNINFSPCFLVSTRSATVTFNGNGQGQNHYAIDLTKWFWAKDIYQNKINFLTQYVGNSTMYLYKIFSKILDDCTESPWSLGILLPRLFNYDYRRLCRVVISALKVGLDFADLGNFENNCKRFISIWDKRKNSDIQHLCRMYILRIILNYFNENTQINNENFDGLPFFNYLMFENNIQHKKVNETKIINQIRTTLVYDDENVYSSYVRNILTILHRFEIRKSISNGTVDYLSFEDLLKELFKQGGHDIDITNDMLDTLSKLLFALNEYSDMVNWAPLTTIKWDCDGQNYSKNKLLEVLKSARSNLFNKKCDNDFGIRINPAGQVLLKILPEFEFYALRFCGGLPRLFENKAMKKLGDNWVAINIIDSVLQSVINCINKVIKRDSEFCSSFNCNSVPDFSTLYRTNLLYKEQEKSKNISTHPVRIFKQQINYLRAYRNFVDSLAPDEARFKNLDEKKEFLLLLDKKITLYEEMKKIYTEKFPTYFEKF